MLKSKIIVSFILIMAIIMSLGIAYAEPGARDWSGWVTDEDQLKHAAVNSADCAMLVDIRSGRILYQKSAYNSMHPASITKIMTCLLTIENAELTDMVTVDGAIAERIRQLDPDSSVSGVKAGEVLTVKDLLYGLMLESGNDAAVTLAYHVGGSYENFITMMNAKAQEIGMSTTSYANPHGLTDEAHKTSARDMALLAMYAKQYPLFNEIVSTVKYKPNNTNMTQYSDDELAYFINSNKLINGDEVYGYQNATGMKTGYTLTSESTFVASAEYDGQSLVAVVLKDTSNGKWDNTRVMFDYGFDFFDTIDIATLYENVELTAVVQGANIAIGDTLTMTVGEGESAYLTESTDKATEIKADPSSFFIEQIDYFNGQLVAPVTLGQQVGTVTYSYSYSHNSDEYLGYKAAEGDVQYFTFTAPLIAANDIAAMITSTPVPETTTAPTAELPIINKPGTDLGDIALYAIVVLGIILVLLIVILFAYRNNSNKRYTSAQNSRNSYDDRGDSARRRRH